MYNKPGFPFLVTLFRGGGGGGLSNYLHVRACVVLAVAMREHQLLAKTLQQRYGGITVMFHQRMKVVNYAWYHRVWPVMHHFGVPRDNVQWWVADFHVVSFNSAIKMQQAGRCVLRNKFGLGQNCAIYPQRLRSNRHIFA